MESNFSHYFVYAIYIVGALLAASILWRSVHWIMYGPYTAPTGQNPTELRFVAARMFLAISVFVFLNSVALFYLVAFGGAELNAGAQAYGVPAGLSIACVIFAIAAGIAQYGI